MLRKIFPYDADNSFFNSFKIIFISEGYLASESALFTSTCIEFVEKLLETAPFNLTKINPNWLSIYSSFVASNNNGPAINTASSANRTAFETSVNTSTELISINSNKLNDHLLNEKFTNDKVLLNLTSEIGKGVGQMGLTGTLIVLLLPSLAGNSSGAEFENPMSTNEYHFIATTANGYWHQLIIRGICKLLGLADEFENAGANYLLPNLEDRKSINFFPNIQYYDINPTTVSSLSKWYRLFSVTKRGAPIDIQLKTGDSSIQDNSLELREVSYDKPQYFEGGGQFRTRVFRSSKDCIMRRQIGNQLLPIRTNLVALSPVSFHYIKKIIL